MNVCLGLSGVFSRAPRAPSDGASPMETEVRVDNDRKFSNSGFPAVQWSAIPVNKKSEIGHFFTQSMPT